MPRLTPRDLALAAMFAALIAVLGLPGGISFAGSVPITLQSFGYMLAGCLLGPWRAALALIIFDLLLMAGMPIAAGGRGGFGVIAGPSGGYLIGAIFGAFVTGWLAQRVHRRGLGRPAQLTGLFLASVIGCMGVVYLVGVPWSAWRLGSGLLGVAQASLQFLPGDLIKAVLAAVVTAAVVRAYPPILAERDHAKVTA